MGCLEGEDISVLVFSHSGSERFCGISGFVALDDHPWQRMSVVAGGEVQSVHLKPPIYGKLCCEFTPAWWVCFFLGVYEDGWFLYSEADNVGGPHDQMISQIAPALFTKYFLQVSSMFPLTLLEHPHYVNWRCLMASRCVCPVVDCPDCIPVPPPVTAGTDSSTRSSLFRKNVDKTSIKEESQVTFQEKHQ